MIFDDDEDKAIGNGMFGRVMAVTYQGEQKALKVFDFSKVDKYVKQ